MMVPAATPFMVAVLSRRKSRICGSILRRVSACYIKEFSARNSATVTIPSITVRYGKMRTIFQ